LSFPFATAKLLPLSAALILISVFTPARAECPFTLDASPEQGTAVFGALRDGYGLELDGKTVPVNDDGRFIVAFHRDYGKKAAFTVIDVNRGKKSVCNIKVKKRKWHVEHVNGVDNAKVTPPDSVMQRIAAESRVIREARKTLTYEHFPYRFIAPVEGRISGVFGSQRIFNGQKRSPHSGHDIASPNGTPVKAAESGTVVVAYPDMYYNGNIVIIDHGYFVNTTYAHLSAFNVKVGDRVNKGDVIGYVGSTGRSTGNHLHLTLNVFGVNVRPDSIIPVGSVMQDKEEYEKQKSLNPPPPTEKRQNHLLKDFTKKLKDDLHGKK